MVDGLGELERRGLTLTLTRVQRFISVGGAVSDRIGLWDCNFTSFQTDKGMTLFRRMVLHCLMAVAALLPSSAAVPIAGARRVPPPGIAVPATGRALLEAGVRELAGEIESLRGTLKTNSALLKLLPDVEIFHKAVRWPLDYDEFLRSNDVALAKGLLRQGRERAQALRDGKAPWLAATGLVVRGYVSGIDGSVQPYGLVVPASFRPGAAGRHRLDVWLHGRDNNLTELKFIADRQRSIGEFAPVDTFVLHPYGRFCNAFKFAGEVDVFEALAHAQEDYPIASERVTVRGFSMGGAGCWHLAAHHASRWAAAAPGAGFAETAEYTKALTKEPRPAWWEQKLWHLYDATDYAVNLFNCPTIAYSGELDKQKQAADVMARAMKTEGLELTHLIGPGVEHKYEPKTKLELARRFDELVARPRPRLPEETRFTTRTLRYAQCGPFMLEALERHWERADLRASFPSGTRGFKISTTNVSAFTLTLSPDDTLAGPFGQFEIDGQSLRSSGLGFGVAIFPFRKEAGRWSVLSDRQGRDYGAALRKKPGSQGPIDDAFMDSFLMVRPTGKPLHKKIGAWVAAELAHATNEWRAQMRGDARVKDDIAITASDIAEHNLVLWGDPQSNKLLAGIAGKLPLRWDTSGVFVGAKKFSLENHAPVLIYPNPLNPERYVVLNSGFTFCEAGHLSNALQTPKLPDWAVLDLNVPIAARHPGGVAAAGFFGERWELPALEP